MDLSLSLRDDTGNKMRKVRSTQSGEPSMFYTDIIYPRTA